MPTRLLVPVVLLLTLASCAHMSPKLYPGLATRKPALGNVAVASDFVVVRDRSSGAGAVLIDRSRHYADAALALAADGMKARGYSMGTQCTASVGQTLDPALHYVVLDSLDHESTIAAVPGGPPPFYLDESLRGGESPAHWAALVRDLWTMPTPRRGQPAHVTRAAVDLHGALGGDIAAVVSGFAWNGRHVRRSPMASATAGYAAWQGSATVVQMALVDTKSGEVLWSDARRTRRPVNDRMLSGMVNDMVRRLP